jgi:hypothetical protein
MKLKSDMHKFLLLNILIVFTLEIANAEDLVSHQGLSITPKNFIEFVKSPPAIDTLIYRRILFNSPQKFRSQQEVNAFVKSFNGKAWPDNRTEELFALRYLSSKEYVFQQIDSITNAWSKVKRLMTFCGRTDGQCWTLTPSGAISTDSTNGIYKTRGEDNLTFAIQYDFATELLKLGMLDLDSESLRQVESKKDDAEVHFIGRSKTGNSITGFAKADDGFISEIVYDIAGSGEPIRSRIIEITHKDGVLNSIQVSNIRVGQTNVVPSCLYEILGHPILVSGTTKISCDLNQFLTPSDRSILVKANGEMFDAKKNASNPLTIHPLPAGMNNDFKYGYKRMILISFFVISLILPIVFLYRNRKNW